MAGRGRGRGRGLSFNIESLGFGKGEALPAACQQPPPLFPSLEFKPAPLKTGEEYDYLLALKQEFRGTARESPFFIKPLEKKRDVERYSDKYQLNQNGDSTISWEPDWNRFPAELAVKKKRVRKKTAVKVKPVLVKSGEDTNIEKTLEELEKKEAAQGVESADEEEAVKSEDEDEEQKEGEEEEIFEDEEFEEETDYNLNYFDNGENYGMDDEEDNLDDGPIY